MAGFLTKYYNRKITPSLILSPAIAYGKKQHLKENYSII